MNFFWPIGFGTIFYISRVYTDLVGKKRVSNELTILGVLLVEDTASTATRK
jgi:hypothetical protein